MGKSWKEKPWKYKNNKDFQKKNHKKNKRHQPMPIEESNNPIEDNIREMLEGLAPDDSGSGDSGSSGE